MLNQQPETLIVERVERQCARFNLIPKRLGEVSEASSMYRRRGNKGLSFVVFAPSTRTLVIFGDFGKF